MLHFAPAQKKFLPPDLNPSNLETANHHQIPKTTTILRHPDFATSSRGVTCNDTHAQNSTNLAIKNRLRAEYENSRRRLLPLVKP
jgi:hypothetical protein